MPSAALYFTAGLLLIAGCGQLFAESSPANRPNFIVILTDDQGYNDLGCYGSPDIKTPRLDQMAKDSIRFTSFYAQTVCGPSRTALLTGCYPLRVATFQNRIETHPLLHRDEITIADLLKAHGYATAAFGKWDLAGHSQEKYEPSLMPLHQGFDYFFGTPTSNDSMVNLLRNHEVIEKKSDMGLLTQRYTDEAIGFIKRSKKQPFFVYLAHSMPHLKLAASPAFRGKSSRGLYGDVVEEIDWQVGRMLDCLTEEGLNHSTYVVYVSDNGPWYLDRHPTLKAQRDAGGSHGGSATPLRGAKTSIWEGGVRVPCIIRPPTGGASGVVSEAMASTMDLFPTIAALSGAPLPTDRIIDGFDMSLILLGKPGAKSARTTFFYYQQTALQAVRVGDWKLHIKRPGPKNWDVFSKVSDLKTEPAHLLYNLKEDLVEEKNVADKHPETVAQLLSIIEQGRVDIGDSDRIGTGARFFDNLPKRPDIKNDGK